MRFCIIGENCLVNLRVFDRSVFSVFSLVTSVYARQLANVTPAGHEVVVPEVFEDIDFGERYDGVLVHFKTATAERAYEVCDRFRDQGVLVVVSGAHPSALPDEAKMHADGVLIGSAECLWPVVVGDVVSGGVKQVYELDAGCVKQGVMSGFLDQARSFKLFGVVEASRGCPYKCDFCQDANMVSGDVFRAREVAEVVAEIKRMPQRLVFFCDVSLTIDPVFSKELFREMEGLGKRFVCEGNADVLARDEELVALSAQAGCIEWTVGFESFFSETLASVHKKTNVIDEYERVVEGIHRYDMAILGNFMFGFDFDTVEVFEYTMDAVEALGLDSARFSIVTPYPGTPLFDRLVAEGRLLTREWGRYNRKTVVFEPKLLSVKELQEGFDGVVKRFNRMDSLVRRCARSVRLGRYPLVMTIGRNVESYLNRPKTR